MITKYTVFINENILLELNTSLFYLYEVDDLYQTLGHNDASAKIMKRIVLRIFKNAGDQAVIDFLKKSLGVEVFNVSKGKYSFEPYSITETIKEDKEKARAKEEKRYLSKSEIERLNPAQRRATVNRRKELGSMNDADLQKTIQK